jgi:hypothetical protein
MNFSYGPTKFEQGVDLYKQGNNERDAKRWEDAKKSFRLARDIFEMCKDEHPEAESLYQEIKAILNNLG